MTSTEVLLACSTLPAPTGGVGGGTAPSPSSAHVSTNASSVAGCQPTGGGNGIPAADPCEAYSSDFAAKYAACGVVGCPATLVACTSPGEAAIDKCLDSCIPMIDCGCLLNPMGTGCSLTTKPYLACVGQCVPQM